MFCDTKMWNDFIVQFFSTIAGGIVLATIFFILSDKIFKISDLNGCWHFKFTTTKTAYNKYNSMVLTYVVLIWMEGKNIHGTGEKIKEKTVGDKEVDYVGKDRIQIKISGYLTKRYILKDKITIHIEEKGKERDSSSIQILKFKSNNLIGKLIATSADSEGDVIWTKQV
jgi:hypothetical protein